MSHLMLQAQVFRDPQIETLKFDDNDNEHIPVLWIPGYTLSRDLRSWLEQSFWGSGAEEL